VHHYFNDLVAPFFASMKCVWKSAVRMPELLAEVIERDERHN
jgi:hypothetical protein